MGTKIDYVELEMGCQSDPNEYTVYLYGFYELKSDYNGVYFFSKEEVEDLIIFLENLQEKHRNCKILKFFKRKPFKIYTEVFNNDLFRLLKDTISETGSKLKLVYPKQ